MDTELINFLGTSIKSAQFKTYIKSSGFSSPRRAPVFFDLPELGIAIFYDLESLLIYEIWFYIQGFGDKDEDYGDYKPFMGNLPGGVERTDSRASIAERLGSPPLTSLEPPPGKRLPVNFTEEEWALHQEDCKDRLPIEVDTYVVGSYTYSFAFNMGKNEELHSASVKRLCDDLRANAN